MSGTIGDARKRLEMAPTYPVTATIFDAELMRAALWDVYAVLGFDTDGDDHYHGTDANLSALVVKAAKEARSDYDEALEDLPNSVDVCKAAGYRVVKLERSGPGEPYNPTHFVIEGEL